MIRAEGRAAAGDHTGQRTFLGRLLAVLGVLAWAPVAMLAMVFFDVQADSSRAESLTLIATVMGFAIILTRLLVAALVWRERRTTLTMLALAMILNASGSVALSMSPDSDVFTFPGPGTAFYLAAATAMAAYLAMDSLVHAKFSIATALEAAMTCGGAACLAVAVLFLPATRQLDQARLPLVGGLIYPLLDLLMVMIIITAATFQGTIRSASTLKTLSGFVLLTVADLPLAASANSSLLQEISGPDHDPSALIYAMWGCAVTLITAGACTPKSHWMKQRWAAFEAFPPISAAFVAVVVLTFRPPDLNVIYVTGPALVTLVAAAARMFLALREARNSAEAYRLSLSDELTGLPNRRAVLNFVAQLDRDGRPVGLLVLDINRFKDVNDTLGHFAGDQVLQILSRRLRAWVPSTSLVARLGADTFGVVVPSSDTAHLSGIALELREVIERAIDVDEHSFLLTATVGIGTMDSGGPSDEVLRKAEIAVHQAKEMHGTVLAYDPETGESTKERVRTAARLRAGLPDKQLRLWYQPQVAAADGQVYGFEALVRWQHPDMGLVPPGDFLPVARQHGLMARLTEEVVEIMLSDVHEFTACGIRARFSFNIAPPELLNAQLMHHILTKVDRAQLEPESLVIEVTEDSFLADPERARVVLHQIADQHIQIAIDDYGTGFSSLQYLRDLPVHELKMDRSFIRMVDADPRSQMIISSTNQMAHGLGLRTVGEGVENEGIAHHLTRLGVDVLQGYEIARPMPMRDVQSWLAARARRKVDLRT